MKTDDGIEHAADATIAALTRLLWSLEPGTQSYIATYRALRAFSDLVTALRMDLLESDNGNTEKH